MMDAFKYILSKQAAWAQNQPNIELVKKGKNHDRLYVKDLKQNLFCPERFSYIKADFGQAAGHELNKKMLALHSSSALVVNVLDFWRYDSPGKTAQSKVIDLVQTCGFILPDVAACPPEMKFEAVFPIETASGHRKPGVQPHLDVVFKCKARANVTTFAIESKFTESCTKRRYILKEEYFCDTLTEIWKGVPKLRQLAESLRQRNNPKPRKLDASQLIKHILGLKASAGEPDAKDFQLLYLWYEESSKHENEVHRRELEEFTTIAKGDGIAFHAKTYQELLFDLYNKYGEAGEYKEYFDYVMGRYF